ncbi:hypothetical protein SESBI_40872 [Sesbania bispinosa]|nr:hypothetical protein SESBI_40872 [Sesbania bispinosa]
MAMTRLNTNRENNPTLQDQITRLELLHQENQRIQMENQRMQRQIDDLWNGSHQEEESQTSQP